MNVFLTNMQFLSSQDINWWTGVVWIIVMFLSAVCQTHFDGTHSLQSCYQLFGLSFWRHPFTAALRGQQFLNVLNKETDDLR